MPGEGIYCYSCGITLRSFMKMCPRCGAAREDATPINLTPPASATTSNPNPANAQTDVVPLNAIRQQRVTQETFEFSAPQDMVFLSPTETERRFPVFTSAQWTLIAIGIGLLILMLAIAYILWQQQNSDAFQKASTSTIVTRPSPTPLPATEPSPTPTPIDDQAIGEAVKSALIAYNPLGFARYAFEVKDGVVTVNGEAAHQPEKDGAENVLKLINGVKSVVNNLKIKPEQSILPVKVNQTEARILDEALKKQIQADEQAGTAQRTQPSSDPQREAERQRREQAAAKQREEELALRKSAEEKIRRETEEYEKRQEELRRVDADRRARAEQAKLETSILRSGTAAWSGIIDGIGEIIFSGSSSSVKHVNGNPPKEVRASFSAPLPRSPVNLTIISANGRGTIQIIQQPSSANGYTTIVRIDDSSKGGDSRYEFTLKWVVQ